VDGGLRRLLVLGKQSTICYTASAANRARAGAAVADRRAAHGLCHRRCRAGIVPRSCPGFPAQCRTPYPCRCRNHARPHRAIRDAIPLPSADNELALSDSDFGASASAAAALVFSAVSVEPRQIGCACGGPPPKPPGFHPTTSLEPQAALEGLDTLYNIALRLSDGLLWPSGRTSNPLH
jgi:hypothetical protein